VKLLRKERTKRINATRAKKKKKLKTEATHGFQGLHQSRDGRLSTNRVGKKYNEKKLPQREQGKKKRPEAILTRQKKDLE
jgi:hypothetical protein